MGLPKHLLKPVENPIKRIYVKEGDLYRVYMVIDVGAPFGDWKSPKGMISVEAGFFGKKEEAEVLQNRLLEIFGIQVKIQRSKIKPVTFAEMVIEE